MCDVMKQKEERKNDLSRLQFWTRYDPIDEIDDTAT